MCGRFALDGFAMDLLGELFEKDSLGRPNWNAAPTQKMPIVLQSEPESLQTANFGIIPVWSKDGKTSYSMINARIEGIQEKRTYAPLLKEHRCVVPASGWYEWKVEKGEKQPYYIHSTEPLVFFAGLYTEWTNPETKEKVKSFAIITTEPNKPLAEIHDRTPAVLTTKTYKKWLSDGKLDSLHPLDAKHVKAYRVSRAVGNPRNNSPELIKEYKSEQGTLA